ncbi:uncharacterized protein LOC142157695 [Mixophyes fleayi]|uniref:uncharacterized protein LOC142157695 n=1 Tax=Mixophyes fleayi TaxID=3061075 RepID=UPI003F4E0DA6
MENVFHQKRFSETVKEEMESKDREEIIKSDENQNENAEQSLSHELDLNDPKLSSAKPQEIQESSVNELYSHLELEIDAPEYCAYQLDTKLSSIDLQNHQEWLLNIVEKLCEWPAEESAGERWLSAGSEDDVYSTDEMEELEDSKFKKQKSPNNVSEVYQALQHEELGKTTEPRLWEEYKDCKESARDWRDIMEDDIKRFMALMEEINMDYQQHFQKIMEMWNSTTKNYQTWGDE